MTFRVSTIPVLHKVRQEKGPLLLLAACLASALVVGCAHNRHPDPSHARPCPSPDGCVTFHIERSPSSEQPHDTPVFIVSRSGISLFGSTDADGLLVVPKATLTAEDRSALLFCWDDRSEACTAIRLDSRTVASYDWVNVTLPSNRLSRRSQAHPAPQATPIPRP